ncbi:MAG TPA: hypothetical protein DIT13_15460 [Verrucomicrobiales bacterium]|nr:hypothetical protein [Verrucomicrobiales bacterium]
MFMEGGGWSDGVMEWWRTGVMEFWSFGVLESWRVVIHYSITPQLHPVRCEDRGRWRGRHRIQWCLRER